MKPLRLNIVKLSIATLLLSMVGCTQNEAHSSATPINTGNTPATTQHSPVTTDSTLIPVQNALQANLNKAGINASVTSISPIAMPDMYLAHIAGMPPVFTDKTGTYILQGDLIKLDTTPINISDQAQAVITKDALAQVDRSELIIFPAKGETKGAIYVFSDPTCHYCQLLHKDVDKINKLGIEVRYLAWPRSEQIKPLAESIWCNANRNQALTDAKQGKSIPPATCDNPVQKHIDLGYTLGVSGTPAVFTADGRQIGGYLPPNELLKAIQN